MSLYQEIDDVVETVANAKPRETKCVLLLGAGCSVSAGVPTAEGFVEIIRQRWPRAYARAAANSPTGKAGYPACMAELSDAARRDLIAEKVKTAKINWAHIAIAQLIRHGFVDRVFTTNFDPLVLRACALVGVFPAVYDFAASQRFKPAYLPEVAVFHLHGQHTGFVLLHTDDQVKRLSESIAPLFDEAGRRRLWIVVGYSGEQDPVFEHLARVDRFDENLYWVTYREKAPGEAVQKALLTEGRSAYLVKGYDADGFFSVLAQRLGCFPPRFIEKPFSHLTDMLETLTPYTLPGQNSQIDLRETPRILIDSAVKEIEDGPEGRTLMAEHHLLAGHYDAVIACRTSSMSERLATAVASAYNMQAVDAADRARAAAAGDADRLYDEAYTKYRAALEIEPKLHAALYNMANALGDQANSKTGAERARLYREAYACYQAALDADPDDTDTRFNWGATLLDEGRRLRGPESDALLAQAAGVLEEALRHKPGQIVGIVNLGIALRLRAELAEGEPASALLKQACARFREAIQLKSDDYRGPLSLGGALLQVARQLTGEESKAAVKEAREQLERAAALKPGCGAYDLACACAMLGDPEACRRALTEDRDRKILPAPAHIETDPDLEPVRHCDWFQALLADLKTKAAGA